MAIYIGNQKVAMSGLVVDNSKLAQLVDGTLTELTASDLEGATQIRGGAFKTCTNLVSVIIPDSVTRMLGDAFYNCSKLKDITFGKNLTSIGMSSFQYCAAIRNVHYLGSIDEWVQITFSGYYANPFNNGNSTNGLFIGGEKIINAIVNASSINNYAFYNYRAMSYITISENVASIGTQALYIGSSTAKATIRMLGSTPPTIQSDTIGSNVEKIIVDPGTLSIWQNATNWSAKASIMEEETA